MLKNKIYADEGDRIFEMVRSRLYINSMRGTMVKVKYLCKINFLFFHNDDW
ncbi:MAG: hypothetical protein HWQ38_17045 [Nostoc sp. NMS7]|uniref:hypothetical protein n=1 Tax=Nostoc sp. NMS7 TaxID=2815391 RepID=UPI0025D5FD86|nr:hypothetical protein [Nostoc sp. NMS7]MBN3948067.1 hypothetical protein [Nostoc sp. NMS7]